MNNLLNFTFKIFIGLLNGICFYIKKIPQIDYAINVCKPYFISLSCNLLFYYGKIEILFKKLQPNEKKYEYLSLYCIEDNDFISCNSEIIKLLGKSDRTSHYLLKFRKNNIIGRLYVSPNKIIRNFDDIKLDNSKLVLSAVYKENTKENIFERDITELLNEYLICNLDNTFKLSDIIDDNLTKFNANSSISIVNNIADEEKWDINTII